MPEQTRSNAKNHTMQSGNSHHKTCSATTATMTTMMTTMTVTMTTVMTMMLRGLCLTAMFCLSITAFAMEQTTPDEILAKIDQGLNPESYVAYKKIINIDAKGVKKEFVLFIGKLGADKVLGAFLAPKTEIGRATLRIGDNMWLYIPNVKKPVRITSLQSVIGGLFNNSDIMGLDFASEYHCVKLQTQDHHYLLELKAKTGAVAYGKVIIKADTTSFIPEFIECYTSSGILIKTLHFKNITEFDRGFRRPAVVETDSPLYKGAKSIMIYSRLQHTKLDAELFNVNNMVKYKELR